MATATEAAKVVTPSTSAGPSSSTASRLQNHPFYRTLVDSAAAYVLVESERDELRLALERSKRDHEAVSQRVKEVERERDQAQRKLKEAEDRENATRQSDRVQVERLLGLAHVVGDAFGTPPSELAGEDIPLECAVSLFDSLCAGAKDALSKTTGALAAVHKSVFPQLTPPASADGLAAAFVPESSTMASFGRAQTAEPSGAPAASFSSSARLRSKNDEAVMAWMKTRIVNLERELKDVRAALDTERARAAPSSEREGVNPDKGAEEARIQERLDGARPAANDTSGATNGLPEKEHYTSTLGWARKVIRQVQDQTEALIGPLDGTKKEPVDR
ncbi:hypothetical protein ACQ4PT_024142 [Festuca glaucescens]